ncbi:MAG: PPC domain-containing protein [Myxococcales bacterium]|nr:PPC domain-containing protein [Myxococcales bacterium]
MRLGPCAANPCTEAHRGVCIEQGAAAVCLCDDSFRDDGAGTCVAAQRCLPNPCQQPNKTQCIETQGATTCSCDVGFRDDGRGGCVSANPCATNPCTQPHRTVCVASGTTAFCQCDSDFVDRAGQCVKVEACTPNPCTQPHRGQCSDVGGAAVCGCDVGFEDRGSACVPVDPCSSNPCTQPHRSVCTSGGDAGVACGCDMGYELGVTGCELIPPPTCVGQHIAGDAYEPDECPALARDMLAGVPQSHTVDPVGDVDFVRFSVDAGARVVLEETGGVSTALTLYAPDGVTVLHTASNPDRIAARLAVAGTYYLGVRAASPAGASSTTISFTHVGVDDQADSEAGANTLVPTTAGTALSGSFEYGGDWDVLAVPVQAGRVYRFEETSGTDTYVRLTSGAGTALVPTQDAPEFFQWRAAASGSLFLGLRHANSSATGSWGALVADVGVDDHSDTNSGATSLAVGAPATPGALQFVGDVDYFSFTTVAGALSLQVVTTGGVDVRVESASGTALTWGSSPATLTLDVPAPGTYFVRVSRAALASYSVRVAH